MARSLSFDSQNETLSSPGKIRKQKQKQSDQYSGSTFLFHKNDNIGNPMPPNQAMFHSVSGPIYQYHFNSIFHSILFFRISINSKKKMISKISLPTSTKINVSKSFL